MSALQFTVSCCLHLCMIWLACSHDCFDRLSMSSSKPETDINGTCWQLAAERAARAEAEQELKISQVKEKGLQRQVAEMQDKLRYSSLS